MAQLNNMAGVDERDQKMIEDAERMLGPEPQQMGFVKNLFWGRVRDDLLSPFPQQDDLERRRCDTLLLRLDRYLSQQHPSIEIDRDQEIPSWVIERLFDLGVMGMTIPTEFGGLGLGITSYNRVLSCIGAVCASTSVMVSTHLSIGCRAIMDFGTDDQRRQWLPHLATHMLSAFCLSEPNVGCDAGGQETRCELSADGSYFIVNGEKKWATSGALSGMFTVTAKQTFEDPDSGELSEGVTALVLYSAHARGGNIRGEPQQGRNSRHLAGAHPLYQRQGASREPAAPGRQRSERGAEMIEYRPLHPFRRCRRCCRTMCRAGDQVDVYPLSVWSTLVGL